VYFKWERRAGGVGRRWFPLGVFENYPLATSASTQGMPGPVCQYLPGATSPFRWVDVVELYLTVNDYVDPAPKLPDFEWGANKYWYTAWPLKQLVKLRRWVLVSLPTEERSTACPHLEGFRVPVC
jgi:hypothetical protein